MQQWRLKSLINPILSLRHNCNFYPCVLKCCFPSLKWHWAVFNKESLCSFQDFLLSFQRQCLKQYKVIAKASKIQRSAFCICFYESLTNCRSNLLLGVWDTIQIGTNSSLGSIIIRKSGEQFSLENVEVLRWIGLSFWIWKKKFILFFLL